MNPLGLYYTTLYVFSVDFCSGLKKFCCIEKCCEEGFEGKKEKTDVIKIYLMSLEGLCQSMTNTEVNADSQPLN